MSTATPLPPSARRVPPPAARLAPRDSQVVLRHGDDRFGDQLGARDVWVFRGEGEYLMHYDAAGADGWLAALATSPDGIHWTKRGPILELGEPGQQDSASASYATTYFDGSRWHLFYLGTQHVTDDGLRTPAFPYMTMKAEASSPRGPWRKRADITPFVAAEGSWYEDTASPGAIIPCGDEYVMIFSGAMTADDGRIWRTLGTARTASLDEPWTVDAEPLLPLTEQIENSALYFEKSTSTWFLFTNHIADGGDDVDPVPPQHSTEYTDAVWVYWAQDLGSFTTANKAVALDAAGAGWSPRTIGLPSVLRVGDRLALYYDGSPEDSISHGHRDIGVAFFDLPLRAPA